MELKRLEFDPEGVNKDNTIHDEKHTSLASDPFSQIISPYYGPFFVASLKNADNEDIPESAWEYGEELPPVNGLITKPLYHSIILKEKINGIVKVTYSSVGSDLVRPPVETADYLINVLNDPLVVKWVNVKGVPHMMPTTKHRQHWIDFQNKNDLSVSIKSIADTIGTYNDELGTGVLALYQSRVAILEETLLSNDIVAHNNKPNAHDINFTDISAEAKNAIAKNADKVFGASYLALCVETSATGLNWDKVSDYLKRYNSDTLEGDLLIEESVNWGSRELEDGLVAKDLFNIASSDSVEVGPTDFSLKISGDGVTLGGGQLYTWAEALEYSKGMNGDLVVVSHSSDFDVIGTGTLEDPFKMSMRYPLATNTDMGFLQLQTEIGTNSSGYGIVSSTAQELFNTIANYLPITTTVNGHQLTNDVVLSKSDIRLNKVDDTADLNKPISDAQRARLSQLSDEDHTHTWDDVRWESATSERFGVDNLTDSPNYPGALTYEVAESYGYSVTRLLDEYETKASVENVRWWQSVDVTVITDDYNLVITNGYIMKCDGGTPTTVQLPTDDPIPFPDEYRGLDKDLLLYAYESDGGVITYQLLDKPETDKLAYMLGIINPQLTSAGKLVNIIDAGSDTKLIEHIANPTPHGLDEPLRELNQVKNNDLYSDNETLDGMVWDGNKLTFETINGFDTKLSTGVAVKSNGGNPLAWRSPVSGGIIYQSSFVAYADNKAAIDLESAEHDIILGAVKGKGTIDLLTIRFTPTGYPKVYIESWGYNTDGDSLTLSGVSYNEISLSNSVEESHNGNLFSMNHYRFFYNSYSDEYRIECISGTHQLCGGVIAGISYEIKQKLLDLLNNPYTGIRTPSKANYAVTGSVRRPHPNTDNTVNDYSGLFHSYISTEAIELIRNGGKRFKTQISCVAYYDSSLGKFVISGLKDIYPNGYNCYNANVLQFKPTSDDFTSEVDYKSLTEGLSPGSITNASDWERGYSGEVLKNIDAIADLKSIEWHGYYVGELPTDGQTFQILAELDCYNVLWGISSADWNYISKHLSEYKDTITTPKEDPVYELNGFESLKIGDF